MWRLDLVAFVAAIVVVCRLALEEDLGWVAWVVAGVAVVLLTVTRWPYGALTVLVGMSAMSVFFVEIFGWKARPEHFAAGIVSLAVAVWLLVYKHRIRLEKLDYWVLAYLATNYIGSAFGSSAPSATLRWALLNNLAVLPYFLIRILVQDLRTLRKAVRILLGVGIVESAYGILCYASNHVFGTTVGMAMGQYLRDVAAPYGSLYEPNLFAAYTGCCAVLFLAIYLAQGQRRISSLVCFFIASLATVLSFSRAALLALVVAIGWVAWKSGNPLKGRRNRLAVFAVGFALILMVAILVAATGVGDVLQERFTNLFQQGLEEETTITRLLVIREALQEVPEHPLIGSGTASLQLSFDWTKYFADWTNERAWVGNVVVRILHDTGLLGLTAFLGFLISLWSKTRRALRRSNPQVPMLIGLSAGALLYGISFQSTEGTMLAFCWVHLGLLASAAILMNGPGHNVVMQGEI